MEWVIGHARNREKAYKALAEYLYDFHRIMDGVHVSSDGTGLMLMYDARRRPPILKAFALRLKLLFRCVGLRRALPVLRRASYIRAHHPKDGRYLHCQYFGVMPGTRGQGAAIELKNLLEQKSRELDVPVYLETTQEKNRKVYERYGFKTFHEFVFGNSEFTTWMMKREPR